MKPVLIIGNITCDVLIHVEHLPRQQDDVMIDSQSMQLGGCAYNVANLFHLNHLPYKLVSVVGSGLYGDFIKQQLKQQGYKHRLFAPEMHGCCYCFIDREKERSFIAHHGIEYSFKPEWLNPYKNIEFAYIYVCGLDIEGKGGNAIIDYLEGVECPIIFAPGPRCTKIDEDKMKRLYALHPILHLNDKEAFALGKENTIEKALIKLYDTVKNLVIITLGEKGSVAKSKEEVVNVKAKPTNVVDTIGAGDAHVASVMMKLIENKSLKETLEYANEISAKIVAKQGATFTKDEFSKLFQ